MEGSVRHPKTIASQEKVALVVVIMFSLKNVRMDKYALILYFHADSYK